MTKAINATDPALASPPPLRISRVLNAPRQTVFAAWTSAEHVQAWFSPETYTVPEAVVDAKVGGAFEVCMRAPDGQTHWTRGTFVEVTPHSRLVIEMAVPAEDGHLLFRARTEVDFIEALGGTRLDVVQIYTVLDPVAAPMMAGAPEGWRTTLDKLEQVVVGIQGGGKTEALGASLSD